MGSYRQPSQVLDTSHSTINKGIEGIYSSVSEQLRANKKALLAQEKENQKLLKQKKLDEIKRVNDLSKIDQKRREANLTVEHSIGPEREGYFNVRDKDNNVISITPEQADDPTLNISEDPLLKLVIIANCSFNEFFFDSC